MRGQVDAGIPLVGEYRHFAEHDRNSRTAYENTANALNLVAFSVYKKCDINAVDTYIVFEKLFTYIDDYKFHQTEFNNRIDTACL